MKSAKPALLEPVMNVEVYAPDQYSGDIMGDLSSRRGQDQRQRSAHGTERHRQGAGAARGDAELRDGLTSMTQGRATYTMEFSHYDYVPERNRGKSDRRGQGRPRRRTRGRRRGLKRKHTSS
jgi:elongation factor G